MFELLHTYCRIRHLFMPFFQCSINFLLFHFLYCLEIAFLNIFIKVASLVKSVFCNLYSLVILGRMSTLLLQCKHATSLVVSPNVILISEYFFLLAHFHKFLFLVFSNQQLSIFHRSDFFHNIFCWLLLLLEP